MGKHKPRKTKASDSSRSATVREKAQNYPNNRKGQPQP